MVLLPLRPAAVLFRAVVLSLRVVPFQKVVLFRALRGGAPGGGGFGGLAGLTRLFNDSFGTEISWLLPAALIALVAGLWLTRRAPRTDRTRAGLLLWGGWLLVTGLTFSFMQGIVHPYYAVVLAPAIGALLGTGGWALWQHRDTWFARVSLAALIAVTGWWSFVLLHRTPVGYPELRYLILAVALLGGAALLVPPWRFAPVVAAVALVASLADGAAFAVITATTAHAGPIPFSGPRVGTPPSGARIGGPAVSGPNGVGPVLGGPGAGPEPDAALVALLKASTTTWAAATTGAQSAAPLQLASGKAIMSIGGFNGADPVPTLAQFQAYVAAGKIHYFLTGGGMGGGRLARPGRSGGASELASWVQAHYTSITVAGQTVYDLTKPR